MASTEDLHQEHRPPEPQANRPTAALDDAERELAVLSAVLKALAAWDSVEQGSERLLRELANGLGQMAGVLWLPQGDLLAPRALWSLPSVERELRERALGGPRIPKGVGLAGAAWEHRAAVDRPSSAAPDPTSSGANRSHELVATIAFACSHDEEVLGVVEMYSTAWAELSSQFMRVVARAGRDVGAFLSRRRGVLGLSPLSPRELDVLTLAGHGHPVAEIAESLTISQATVKTHLEHIYRKLGVQGRTAAVAHALRAGYIE
jgi:DNA-binding CsgD family transcriptional regulator